MTRNPDARLAAGRQPEADAVREAPRQGDTAPASRSDHLHGLWQVLGLDDEDEVR